MQNQPGSAAQHVPASKNDLFQAAARPGYWQLKISREEIKTVIFEHPEFAAYSAKLDAVFSAWKSNNAARLKEWDKGCLPKAVIKELAEDMLQAYQGKELVDNYAVCVSAPDGLLGRNHAG